MSGCGLTIVINGTVTVGGGGESPPVLSWRLATVGIQEGQSIIVEAEVDKPFQTDLLIPVLLGAATTATEGDDFELSGGGVLFTAGATRAQVTVTALADLDIGEPQEIVELRLADVSGGDNPAYTLGSQSSMQVLIANQGAPTVGFGAPFAVALPEDQLLTTAVPVTVEGVVAAPITVDVQVGASSTGTEGVDFIFAGPAQVTFEPGGAATVFVFVTVPQDTAVEADETCVLEIASISGGGALAGASGSQSQTFTLTIENDDSAPVDPLEVEWNRASDSAPESSGAQFFPRLRVTRGGEDEPNHGGLSVFLLKSGTARHLQPNRDVVIENPGAGAQQPTIIPVTIPDGLNTLPVPITILDDADPEGDETLSLEIAGSSAFDRGPQTTYTLTILNDGDAAAPVVRWASGGDVAAQGQGPAVLRVSRAQAGDSDLTVTIRVASFTALLGNYTVTRPDGSPGTWGSGGAGASDTITIPAGQTTVDAVRVTNVAATTGQNIVFEIVADAAYDIGTPSTSTVAFVAQAAEPTLLVFELGTGLPRNIVQGPVAIDPPVADLSTVSYDLDGEQVQLTGLERDPLGRWRSATFFGWVDTDADSVPGEPSPLEIGPSSGGTVPPEAGNYPDVPDVTFELEPSNAGALFSRSIGNATFSRQEWFGPGGVNWDQTGPDLVKEERSVLWLARAGSDLNDFSASLDIENDRCAIVELTVRRIAGLDLAIVEGHLFNAAWAPDSDFRISDVYDENPYTDGEVFHRGFKCRVSGVAGWTITHTDSHPGMALGAGSTELTFLPSLTVGAEDYYLPPGASYGFRFAMRGPSVPLAVATAYLRDAGVSATVGSLGLTRANILGEAGDNIPDLNRAHAFAPSSGGIKSWREGITESNNDFASEYLTGWANGTNTQGFYTGRLNGWFQGTFGASGGASSGDAIDGVSVAVPSTGWYRKNRILLYTVMMRHRTSAMEPRQGFVDWWWRRAVTVGGQRYMPWIVAGGNKQGLQRDYGLTEKRYIAEDGGEPFFNISNPEDFALAPDTRPWNTPEGALPGDLGAIRDYTNFDFAHVVRALQWARDGWWMQRSLLAFRLWENVASHVSRARPPVPLSPNMPGVSSPNAASGLNIPAVRVRFTVGDWLPSLPPGGAGRGNYTAYGNLGAVPQTREIAWAYTFLFGFYGIAPTSTRPLMRGQGSSLSTADVLRVNWDFLAYVMMPCGLVNQRSDTSAKPNPYSASSSINQGPTDLANRRGALPRQNTPGNEFYSFDQEFHTSFLTRAVFVARRVVFENDAAQRDRCNAAFFVALDQKAAALSAGETRRGPFIWPVYYVAGVGTQGTNNPPTTRASRQAGALWWQFFRSGNLNDPEGGQIEKVGYTSGYAWRVTGDPAHLELLTQLQEQPGLPTTYGDGSDVFRFYWGDPQAFGGGYKRDIDREDSSDAGRWMGSTIAEILNLLT